ncbi:MAG TPA: hypothetical protein DCY20_05310 [Firmicutes bacterium]|nr:hypothetical protein [Bacillota bacterium]
MKMSQREKYLLMIVGSVLVAVLYFQFVFAPQRERITELQGELFTVQTRYDEVMSNIRSLQKRQEQIKGLNMSISEKTAPFYPTLIQEKIILELDEMIEETAINATISFSPITAQAVQGFTAGSYEKPESSLKSFVDEYGNLVNDEVETEVDTGSTKETSNSSSATTSSATAEVMTVSVTFNGAYDVVKTFIDTVQNWDYNLVITNLSLSPQNQTDVSGSLNLEFYGVPKLSAQDQAYLEWTLENTYGKDMPFSTGVASGAYNTMIEDLVALGVRVNDLMMVVRSSTSDLPPVTVGKANDESRESYLFSDNKDGEDVEIQLTQDGEKYYFKYFVGEQSYPQEAGKGIEFTPRQNTINIQILSEDRVTTSDNSVVSVKIKNQTDKTVDVEIKSDDKDNPRVTIIKDGTVNITNK